VGEPSHRLWEYLRSDFEATRDMDPTRARGLMRTFDVLTQAGFLSLALYRVGAALHARGHKLLARLALHLNLFVFNCEIYPQTVIGPGAAITHPLGVAIGAGVVMGRGVRIHGLVRIGTAGYEDGRVDGFPVIGDGCRLFDHAMLFGPIEIGADSKIGANVLLLHSVPAGSVVAAPQGVVLPPRRSADSDGPGSQEPADLGDTIDLRDEVLAAGHEVDGRAAGLDVGAEVLGDLGR
jgi:serine O-acetyltransferase